MYLSDHDSSCHLQTEDGIFNNQQEITSRITDNDPPTIESNHNREKEKESSVSLDLLATNYSINNITTHTNNNDHNQYSGTSESCEGQQSIFPSQSLTHQPNHQNILPEQPILSLQTPTSPSSLENKYSTISTSNHLQEEGEETQQTQESQPPQSQQPIPKPNNHNETDRKPLSRLSPTSTSRLAIPKATPYRGNSGERSIIPRYPSRTLNRLEVENAYLSNQNTTLNKDIQYCRQTVQALKSILAQKEEMIDKMRQEFHQAYLKTKFMESILHGQQNLDIGKAIRQARGGSKGDELLSLLQGFDSQERGRRGGEHSGYIVNQFDDEEEEDIDYEDDDEDEDEDEDDLSGEDDISDQSETISNNHDGIRGLDRLHNSTEDYQDEENSDKGKIISPSQQRFRELNLNTVSHTSHISPTLSNNNEKFKGQNHQLASEGSSSSSSSSTPQENRRGLDSHINQRQGAGSQQVIRRRPRLQMGTVTSGKTSPMPSTPIAALSIKIPSLRPPSPSSQSGSETENDSDDQIENTGNVFNQPDQLIFRDSGHFQNENFPWDDSASSSKFNNQSPASEAQTNANDMQYELVCISDSLVFTSSSSDSNGDDDDEVAGVMNNVISSDSFRNTDTQQNNHPYLGITPSTAPVDTLTRTQIEASASSTTLTTGSTTSLVGSVYELQEDDNRDGNNRSAMTESSNTASISPEGSLESDMDEDRSESSITTTSTSTPLTTTFDQTDISSTEVEGKDSLEALQQNATLHNKFQQDEKIIDNHQQKSTLNHEGIILLVDNPLVVREDSTQLFNTNLSSKLKGKGGFNRARGRSFTQSREWTMNMSESYDDSTLTGVSNSISSNSVSTGSFKSKILVGSTMDESSLVGEEPVRQGTILSRIWSGFGKHVSGLMTGGRQSPERGRRSKSGKKSISKGLEDSQGVSLDESSETRPTSPGSSSDVKRKKSNERAMASKGIGIRRLVRQKSPSHMTTAVSVISSDGNAAVAMTT
ncbi:hypothetical protein BGZ76_006948 [Entomortierella beljakovae]|nr:hypothetical protein BGZ76_006948 [Entomortierella beljakovae]